ALAQRAIDFTGIMKRYVIYMKGGVECCTPCFCDKINLSPLFFEPFTLINRGLSPIVLRAEMKECPHRGSYRAEGA
ncbi:MAG: hypothetical protein ACI9PZ_001221, partial [Parvicella sp.]